MAGDINKVVCFSNSFVVLEFNIVQKNPRIKLDYFFSYIMCYFCPLPDLSVESNFKFSYSCCPLITMFKLRIVAFYYKVVYFLF